MRIHLASLLMLAAAPASVGSTTGCSQDCTLVGCDTRVTTTLDVAATEAELTGAKVKMCVAAGCAELTLAASTTLAGAFDSFDGSSSAQLMPDSAGAFDATLVFALPGEGQPIDEEPRAEKVTMTVTSSDGTKVLAQIADTPTYEAEYPNGDDCGIGCFAGEI